MSAHTYRPDIDGLRAIAVLPVILFHSGIGTFTGGFVGVDIFFVISGYLITRIIWSETQAGSFSILHFYERRTRRIFPALSVVLFTCLVTLSPLMLANQLEQFAQSILYTLLFSSNFFFWNESGYFAPNTDFMPLLHTWSLAVEEQFYIGFPLFIAIICWTKKKIQPILILLTMLLFMVNLYLSYSKPSAAFYLLPARAWELLTGALLAMEVLPEIRSQRVREAAALTGAGLIAASFFLLDSRVVFPGFAALLPCLGAAIIIHSGDRKTLVTTFLSIRPLVFIGLLSYSLYLWHWPVFTSIRLINANIDLPAGKAILGIAVSFLLAWITWRFIERPFRDHSRTSTRLLIGLGCSSAILLIAASSAIIQNNGLPGRLTERTLILQNAAKDIDPQREACRTPFPSGGRGRECRFGPPEAAISYVIIGDSHAAAIRPAIEVLFKDTGRAGTLWWQTACPPLLGAEKVDDPGAQACKQFHEDFLNALKTSKEIDTVVLAGRWVPTATGIAPDVGGSFETYLQDKETLKPGSEETPRVFSRAIQRTIDAIRAMGKEVLLIGGVPEIGFDVPTVLALAAHNRTERDVSLNFDTVRATNAIIDDMFQSLEQQDGVTYLSIWDFFCHNECVLIQNGIPLYSDDDHITYRAAREIIGPQLRERALSKGGKEHSNL